ncbi:MAG: DUF1326 domain-containing protein [Chloroflexi bacterium]|nr:MAG: DUF1326 domain-containing protein [Chloroflexota bacterium]
MAMTEGATAETATKWTLKGVGYEFCNCAPGCTCNFSGFPSSKDGSCKAFVGCVISEGKCGDVDLAGITCAAVIDWPKAIHEGGGKAVFIVPEKIQDDQMDALAKIFTGQLKGLPWEILGTTYSVAGVVKADLNVGPKSIDTSVRFPGVVEATGASFKNPVTGEPHQAAISLDDGFIWKRGECGVGSFKVDAGEIHLDFHDTNWILYDFDWSN